MQSCGDLALGRSCRKQTSHTEDLPYTRRSKDKPGIIAEGCRVVDNDYVCQCSFFFIHVC